MNKKKGFSLVEMLLVVAIVSILAAIAAPPYLHYVKKARASEAVATLNMIRQSLRDYYINNNKYFDIGSGNILNGIPTSVDASGVPTPNNAGLDIDVGVAQYFSNAAYSVDASSPVSPRFTNPNPVDFIITVTGNNSVACGNSNCAVNNSFQIIKTVEKILGVKAGDDFNPKKKIEIVSCLGKCGEGPIMIVNGKVFEKIKPAKVQEILEKYF